MIASTKTRTFSSRQRRGKQTDSWAPAETHRILKKSGCLKNLHIFLVILSILESSFIGVSKPIKKITSAKRPIIETTTKHHFRSSLSLSPTSCSLTLQTSGSSTLKSLLFSNLYANTCTKFFNSSIQNSYLKTVFFLKSDSFFLTSVFQTHYFKPNLTLSKKKKPRFFERKNTLQARFSLLQYILF